MALSFKRPVGAAVDVKELEYISALHQTGMPSIRQDASIRDVDIVLFLKSRYGIVVTTDYVRKTVMKGLGGGDDEEEAIDLVELVSIILIPLLIKASRSSIAKLVGEERARTKEDFEYANDYWRYCEEKKIANKLAPPENIIEDVFSLLMGGATGDPSPKKLDENLVRSILSAHGENDLANDDLLVKEMVSAATTADTDNGSEPMFDSNAFAHALAGDIQDYKVENETKKTTAYFDVFGSHTYNEEEKVDTGIDLDQEARSSRPDKIKTEFTFASIDFVSGNYQSKTLAAALWTLFLIIFISYKEKVPQVTNALVCTKAQNLSFGCKVARHSLIWLEIFLEIFIFGLMFIGLGSIGNDIQSKRKYLIILGILVVGSVTFREYLNTPIPPDALFIDHFHRALPFALTFIVFFLQFNLLLGQYIPRKLLRSSRMLDSWFTPGNVVAESQTKQSAAYKINHLVKNARNLFGPSEELNSCQFSQGAATKALLNYGKKGKIFMTQGGFIWTWKRIFSLELFNENGIWISGRIIAGNFSQLLISVVIIVFGLSLTYYVDENLTTTFNELTSFMNLQQNEIEGIAKELVEHMNDRIGTTMRDSISENLDKYVLSGNLSLARNLTETWFNDTMETVLQYAYGSFRNETGSFNCFVEENLTNECKKTKRRHLKLQQNLAYMMTGPVSQNTKDSIEHGIRQIHESMAETQTIVTPERRRSRPHEDTEKWSVSKISQNAQGLEFCEDFSISEFCDSIEHFKNQVYDDFNSDEVFIEVTDQAIIFLNRTVEESTVSREEMLLTEVIQFSQKVSANTIEKLRPTHVYMITAPMYVGTFAAFLAILYIAVSLIPSAVTTTLRFRSGMIPTFRDPKFSKLRTGQEAVTKILGFILWGGFVSSAIFGALVAFIVFLFLYQVTRDVIFSFSAMAIGITITMACRTLIVTLCKLGIFKGFYRTKPARANISMLGLESTNIALSVFFVIIRFVKIIAVSFMYIGRVDTPFLAPGVGCIGPVELDNSVTMFWKTILAHEAHRHPYIETLGSMYLMKLHYGEKFAKTSGSCWRILFVLTLMPWLRKYRIMTRPALKESDTNYSDDDASIAGAPLNKSVSNEYLPSGINDDKQAQDRGEVENLLQFTSLLQEEIAKLKEENKLLKENAGPAI